MKKFFLLTMIALLAAGCGKQSAERADGKTDGDISVESYINAKARRDYASMWKCFTPRVQKAYGSFEAFKAEQEETYQLLGESGWQTMTDQMRADRSKIRAVEIDGKCLVDEK